MKTYKHPHFIPAWQDSPTLAAHISVSQATLENWVSAGILPPPVKRGNKLMWEWAEVHEWLKNGPQAGVHDATGAKNAVKREREADRHAGH
jgi:predicted DNA-binding transcriptional regulator AlpA